MQVTLELEKEELEVVLLGLATLLANATLLSGGKEAGGEMVKACGKMMLQYHPMELLKHIADVEQRVREQLAQAGVMTPEAVQKAEERLRPTIDRLCVAKLLDELNRDN